MDGPSRTERADSPVLRLTCLKAGRVDLGARKSGKWSTDDAKRYLVAHSDFFVARGNGSLALVGRGALVEDQPGPVAFPDTLIRVRPDPKLIEMRFFRLCWNSACVRSQVEGSADQCGNLEDQPS